MGRARGRSQKGEDTRLLLYQTAVQLFAERGYEQTTMRDIAAEAGVSVGLLYRYFPNKSAVVLALYDALSADYAERMVTLAPGAWATRAMAALETSLEVLGPHRAALAALSAELVSTSGHGLFAEPTAFSRARVQRAFADAVAGADDAPDGELCAALGRQLYVAHLAVILWWLLDKSPAQRATSRLLGLLRLAAGGLGPMLLLLPGARAAVMQIDEVVTDALL
ncbi:MAG: TetR/AcrR family transcriptional regulator [Myxococcales bacterium]|nr:TetR/AcrR family transcriptional regulator [Myxococcales bacterium]